MKKVIVLLIISMFLLSGCIDPILDDMFGWIPGYQPRSSSSSGQSASQSSQNVDVNSIDNIKNSAGSSTEGYCEPHGTYNGKVCVCDSGYVASGFDCVPGNRECVYDKDCGTNGCEGDYKVVYRCDLTTYKCIPKKGVPAEKVNCKTEYGDLYVCYGGQCIPNPVQPIQR